MQETSTIPGSAIVLVRLPLAVAVVRESHANSLAWVLAAASSLGSRCALAASAVARSSQSAAIASMRVPWARSSTLWTGAVAARQRPRAAWSTTLQLQKEYSLEKAADQPRRAAEL